MSFTHAVLQGRTLCRDCQEPDDGGICYAQLVSAIDEHAPAQDMRTRMDTIRQGGGLTWPNTNASSAQ